MLMLPMAASAASIRVPGGHLGRTTAAANGGSVSLSAVAILVIAAVAVAALVLVLRGRLELRRAPKVRVTRRTSAG
jgi:hypothetical protein